MGFLDCSLWFLRHSINLESQRDLRDVSGDLKDISGSSRDILDYFKSFPGVFKGFHGYYRSVIGVLQGYSREF